MRLLLFAEAPGDAQAAALLVDRVLSEHLSWSADLLAIHDLAPSTEVREARKSIRQWVHEEGHGSDEPTFVDVHHLADVRGRLRRRRASFRPPRGHFQGQPGDHASKLGREVFALAQELGAAGPVEAVILVHDMDGDTSRRNGLQQAREEAEKRYPFRMILGCPNECMEAWYLAAFIAKNTEEKQRIARVRRDRNLSFDPCEQAHLLSHKMEAPKSAKKILDEISGEDRARVENGLRFTELAELRRRGQEQEASAPGEKRGSGLADFLEELVDRLVPLASR